MSTKGRRGGRGRGFTVVELLVVMGIVTLLMSILIPTVGKARQSAQATVCASNLRQVAAALTQYEIDNRGRLPRTNDASYGVVRPSFDPRTPLNKTWVDLLCSLGYIRGDLSHAGVPEVLRCPSGQSLDNDPTWAGYMPHYAMNVMISPPASLEPSLGRGSFGGRRTTARTMGASRIFLVEARHLANGRGWYAAGNFAWVSLRHGRTVGNPDAVNVGGSANVAYLDGSVALRSAVRRPGLPVETDASHPFARMYFARELALAPSW